MTAVASKLWRHGRSSLILVVILIAVALSAPWMAPYDPNRIDVLARDQGLSALHWLGTDHLGRDVLSRILLGTQLALGVALVVVTAALAVGTLLGVLAASAPRQGERALLIAFDILGAFPSLIFALAFVALLGPGLLNVMIVVTVTLIPQFGRVARAQVLALRQAPFLEAERALGAGPARILFVHVLPNIMGALVVLASIDIPAVITVEAALSFLGIGVKPPLASLGALLHDGYEYLDRSAWPALAAGVALMVVTLGFTLFGEALRDAVDPKFRAEP
ncbi:MAG: ABC transporter permease [Alphaproteobacteria bacterium]